MKSDRQKDFPLQNYYVEQMKNNVQDFYCNFVFWHWYNLFNFVFKLFLSVKPNVLGYD